jgi:negative regulator of sigma E activity
MSDKSNEQISNLMDGELDNNASKFLLKRMASDDALSKTWDSYHLIKSCLQKEKNQPLIIDIAGRVSEQLGLLKDKQEIAAQEPQMKRWLKPVFGVGIAASVALLSVIMLQNRQIGTPINGLATSGSASIAQTTVNLPIRTNISANVATSDKTIVPPPSLSRFPSVSSKNTYNYNQGYSHNINMPYLIIINQPVNNANKQLSPMRIKDVAD